MKLFVISESQIGRVGLEFIVGVPLDDLHFRNAGSRSGAASLACTILQSSDAQVAVVFDAPDSADIVSEPDTDDWEPVLAAVAPPSRQLLLRFQSGFERVLFHDLHNLRQTFANVWSDGYIERARRDAREAIRELFRAQDRRYDSGALLDLLERLDLPLLRQDEHIARLVSLVDEFLWQTVNHRTAEVERELAVSAQLAEQAQRLERGEDR